MKILQVPDMHCSKCVERISKALKQEGILFEVKLEERIVAVEEGKVELAVEVLDDLGFEAK